MEKICMVIDLEGFQIKSRGGFHFRELGFCDWKRLHVGSKSYQIEAGYLMNLPLRDRKTVEYVTKHIHGLPYTPAPQENARPPSEIDDDVCALYRLHRTQQRDHIGYKGGPVERDLLTRLNIPSHDLEIDGCPPLRRMERLIGVTGCGHHKNPTIHHCPRSECTHYVNWMRQESGLSFQTPDKFHPDFVYPL